MEWNNNKGVMRKYIRDDWWKKGEVRGQITVIASLSLILVLSLVAAVFQSIKISALSVHIQQSCRLATEAVFSGYSDVLLDEFDILLLKKSDTMDDKLTDYVRDNLSMEKDVELVCAYFDQLEMVTDRGGENIRKEVLAYMKYGVMSDAVKALIQSEEQVKKAEKIKEVTSKISSCEEAAFELDEQVLQLIELVEGIDTTETGFVIKGGKPQASDDYFVKAAVNGMVTMNATGVHHKLVYDALNNANTYYKNVNEIFEDICIDVDELMENGDEETENTLYQRSYKDLKGLLEGSNRQTEKALELLGKHKSTGIQVGQTIGDVQKQIEQDKEVIGEEFYDSVCEDLNQMRTAISGNQRRLCDITAIEEELKLRQGILNEAVSYLEPLNVRLGKDNCLYVKEKAEECARVLAAINNERLSFDYSQIDFTSNSTGLSAIRKIYHTLTDSLMKLVLQEQEVSAKKLTIKDLASSFSGNYSREQGMAEEVMDTAIYDSYLLDRFTDYTDMRDGKENTDLLDYSLEYILCGEDSDQENLKETMMKLSGIREGMNLAYLVTDAQKKAEALSLATTLLGFTGNMAIIKGGQYFIMTVWAYGESIMELRKLYAGEKVELIKQKENWMLSMENLLKCNLSLEQDKSSGNKEVSQGIAYGDYLRILLMIENTVDKNFQTMAAMEMRMIGKGYTDFRMQDYVFGASGTAAFTRKGMNGLYLKDIQYSYA